MSTKTGFRKFSSITGNIHLANNYYFYYFHYPSEQNSFSLAFCADTPILITLSMSRKYCLLLRKQDANLKTNIDISL